MDSASREYEKVLKRQKTCTDTTLEGIESLLEAVKTARNRISQGDPTIVSSCTTAIASKFKSMSSQILESHKELHSSTSKYNKILDKRFKTDLDTIWDYPNAFDDKEAVLNNTLHGHFVREGRFELASVFADEAGVMVSEALQDQFAEMFDIREELRSGRLSKAVVWAQKHRKELEKQGSSLEFQLHRLQFIQYLTGGGLENVAAGITKDQKPVQRALLYSKHAFGPFAQQYMKEIQRLLGSVLFATRLPKSPYADFLSPNLWVDAHTAFTRSFCALLGLSSDSPLYVSVTVGASALPTIAKMTTILKERSGLEWSSSGELPVEVPLLDTQKFHSVFACPVSKEQATEENYPMMMACGHVVNKDSLNRLCKGNQSARFKCPYCPNESTALQAQRIYF
ncbi:hypothetical protein SmJEL517_g05498 [Synchytrium microbalum]|uniref:GID complex catalytic subunit 2 n=1 Tax=Synchytrium microbalum TaxID=1806994 RepID=A0A507C0L4_9FUNG|nr:uncharacterized protein SmJEL517_g05498 [Synchytrium microbalum]TPX31073.1 hypothetical protein SmJEL517_g05498 [Synchytrium microbalum]